MKRSKLERISHCPYCNFELDYGNNELFSFEAIDDRDWIETTIENAISDVYENYDIECSGCYLTLIFETVVTRPSGGNDECVDWLYDWQKSDEANYDETEENTFND